MGRGSLEGKPSGAPSKVMAELTPGLPDRSGGKLLLPPKGYAPGPNLALLGPCLLPVRPQEGLLWFPLGGGNEGLGVLSWAHSH